MRFIIVLFVFGVVNCRFTVVKMSEDDYTILQKTIYLYSTGQPLKVEQAIAFTLLNRYKANRPEFGGRSISAVCLKLWEYALPDHVEIPEHEQRKMNEWLRKIWKDPTKYDPTKGALYFKFPDENDYWPEGMEKTVTIKAIEFYKD